MTPANAALALGLVLGAAPALSPAADPAPRRWHFTVFLDGRAIGQHDFVLTRQGDDFTVDTAAHFAVTVAFIPVYRYVHQDHERWQGGCLAELTSRTDDNGHIQTVSGTLRPSGFEVAATRGSASLPACVRSFAYWDRALLMGPRLLNSQTGAYQRVRLDAAPAGSGGVGGRALSAQHYTLRGPHLDIELWYSAQGEWLGLQSRLDGGRILSYELR